MYKKLHKDVQNWLKGCGHLHGDEIILAKYPRKVVKRYLAKRVRLGNIKRPYSDLYHI